jgi:hypothetical protein
MVRPKLTTQSIPDAPGPPEEKLSTYASYMKNYRTQIEDEGLFIVLVILGQGGEQTNERYCQQGIIWRGIVEWYLIRIQSSSVRRRKGVYYGVH